MNSAKYLFQNIILNYTKTGNYIFDYILNFSILSFISYLCDNIKFFQFDFSLFFSNNYSQLIIESRENSNNDKNSYRRMIYTKIFKSIIYYIKITKPKGIFIKRESDKINENDDIFEMFIPDQKEYFLIEKDILCQIKMSKTYIDKYNGKEISKLHTIKLFSYNKNINTSDLEDFVNKCLNIFNEFISNKLFKNKYYFSYVNSENNIPFYNEREFITNRTFDTIFFEEKNNYFKSLKFFIENEDWYIKKGLPYHYGILLHGEPGCGKTSIIKATLKYTNRNAVTIPLDRIQTCGELENIFFNNDLNDKFIPNNKKIYIFDDIDCLCEIVKDRELGIENRKDNESINIDNNVKKIVQKPEDKLTLACLLNIIDGILEIPGRIIILTTNYIDKIDKALLRPGRIDFNICLKRANIKITKELLSFFYEKDINEIDILTENKLKNYILTPAQIMNICQNNINNIQNCINEIKQLSNIIDFNKNITYRHLPC